MTTSLAYVYADWDLLQSRILKMIAPLTPEQLLLRSAAHMWHVSGMAAHIVGVRAFWIHQIMPTRHPTLGKPLRRC